MTGFYVSYTVADREFAEQIEKHLESLNYKNFSKILSDGESLEGAITAQISKAEIIVIVYSSATSESKFTKYEIDLATSYENKIVIPILLDGAKPPPSLKERLYLSANTNNPLSVIPNIDVALLRVRELKSRERTLLISTFISFLAALVGAFTSFVASSYFDNTLSVFNQIHWTVWVCCLPALYGIGCYINDCMPESRRKLKTILTVPYWTQLRAFGDKRIARISYIAIAIIPVIAYTIAENPFEISMFDSLSIPLGFRLTFFASWFFAIALILFVAGCPKEYRKHPPLEGAKTVNLFLHDSPGSNVKVDSPVELEDVSLDSQALELRAMCFLFYLLGISVATIIMARAAWFVTNA